MLRNFTRFILLIALLLVSTVAQADPAQTLTVNPELTTRVRAMLGGYERTPQPHEWQRLPADTTEAVLVALASAEDEPHYVRARAIASMVHFPGAEARALIRSAALQEPALMLRRVAIQALVTVDPAEATALLPTLLGDADEFVREATMIAFEEVERPEALSAFEAAFVVESKAHLKARLTQRIEALKVPAVP